MIQISDREGKGFYLNKKLKQELDIALHAVKNKNQDLVIVVDGQEGSGKSTASRQIAYYCSQALGSNFDVDGMKNIHNDLNKYIFNSSEGKKFEAHILDESRKVLNRKRSMAKEAVRFTNYLSECRFMNQVHILCIPAYHDLDRYVAQWRVGFVIHMSKEWRVDETVKLGGHELHLGTFTMFVNDGYLKHFYDQYGFQYPKKWIAKDRFTGYEVLSEEGNIAYDKQKYDAMQNKYIQGKDEVESVKSMCCRLSELHTVHFPDLKIPVDLYCDYFGKAKKTVWQYLQALNESDSDVLTNK